MRRARGEPDGVHGRFEVFTRADVAKGLQSCQKADRRSLFDAAEAQGVLAGVSWESLYSVEQVWHRFPGEKQVNEFLAAVAVSDGWNGLDKC